MSDLDTPIEIHVTPEQITQFDQNISELFYSTRPAQNECVMRYNVLTLVNNIWQSYLIEKEQNAMINKSNTRYANVITDTTSIEIETIETPHTKPYKKYTNTKANENGNYQWCTPTEGPQKVIIIREYENGPIIKKVIIPSVLVFGSIAFGLDGIASDIDLALPAGIYKQFLNAHTDTSKQVKLLREFNNRLKINANKSKELGLKWKIEPILHARVPIIKLEDIRHKLCVDISIRSSQTPITQLIRYYCAYDEKVALFYMFIKQWSKVRQISDAMYGFPNSFGFVMLATKFLQLLPEPLIPIADYDRNKKRLVTLHSIENFCPNRQSLLELAVSFFDYYFNFDFETYQIGITDVGLQWKHPSDYNCTYADQSTMLIEDPSCKSENVTRCLKPYNLKIMRQELFRAYKCCKHGDWALLFRPFDESEDKDSNGLAIFEVYPPSDDNEEQILYEVEEYSEYDDYEKLHLKEQMKDKFSHFNSYNSLKNNGKKKKKTKAKAKVSKNYNNKKYIKKKQNFQLKAQ